MNGTEEVIVLLFIFCCFSLVLIVGGIVADYFDKEEDYYGLQKSCDRWRR